MPGAERGTTNSAPTLQGRRLVMRDNVHLFDPGAEHHEVLATEGTGATSPGNPSLPVSASSCSENSREEGRQRRLMLMLPHSCDCAILRG